MKQEANQGSLTKQYVVSFLPHGIENPPEWWNKFYEEVRDYDPIVFISKYVIIDGKPVMDNQIKKTLNYHLDRYKGLYFNIDGFVDEFLMFPDKEHYDKFVKKYK